MAENDVLITIAGINVGKCGIVKKKHLPANTNQAVAIIRPDNHKVVPYFIYYSLKTPLMFQRMQKVNGQTAQPNINLETLGNLEIPIPPLTKQEKIASILSTYDDLIEVNEKRIKILEEMAQRLYTEWFVKFKFPGHEKARMVPVETHCNASLRQNGNASLRQNGNASLRQNGNASLHQNDLIPDGWSEKSLGDKLNILKETEPKIIQNSRSFNPAIDYGKTRVEINI